MKLITFDIFKPFNKLFHVFSTRIGGISVAPFDGLNLGLHTADNPQDVKKNRRLFFEKLSISRDRVVFPEQVHSSKVQIVSKPGIVEKCDGLITSQKNLFLSVQTADCFPVFLYDPNKEVIALIHSGWRGTASNICGETILMMKDRLGCNPHDILAAVGPGVQQNCYQVDEKTAAHFASAFLLPDGEKHYKLNVQEAIVAQLREKGVPAAQIEIDSTCTHCAVQLYYSYRRDGAKSGRMMGIIGIREI